MSMAEQEANKPATDLRGVRKRNNKRQWSLHTFKSLLGLDQLR